MKLRNHSDEYISSGGNNEYKFEYQKNIKYLK